MAFPTTPDTTPDEGVAKVAELISDIKVAMLTTADTTGRAISRPMAVMEVEFDGDLWFISDGDARKVEQISAVPRVNVTFSATDSWLSVAGTAEIVRDVEKTRELWSPGVSAWWPEGPETPGLVLLKIHADGAEYWDTPGPAIASLVSFVKAKVTGEPLQPENETVAL